MPRNTTYSLLLGMSLLALAACGDEASGGKTCEPGAGIICTHAGTGISGLSADGLDRLDTDFYLPQDLTFGPDDLAYLLDWNNHRIRVIEADSTVTTLIGTGQLGDASPGYGSEVNLNHPTHVTFAPNGNMIIAAWHNSKVLSYDFATDQVTPLCGTGARSFGGDGGPAAQALLDLPVATGFGPDGLLYIADQANQRIRAVDAEGNISTVVGTGTAGYGGDGGPAIEAQVNLPVSQSAPPAGRLDMAADGTIYLADTLNNRIRIITPDGIIDTLAGNGQEGFAGDGGPAVDAQLDHPSDVEVMDDGTVFIADTLASCVRQVDTAGIITTVAGICGQLGFEGDGGPASEALLNRPYGVEVGPDGNLYIADTHNHRIRIVYLQ